MRRARAGRRGGTGRASWNDAQPQRHGEWAPRAPREMVMAMRLSAEHEGNVPATAHDPWSATCDALLSGLAHALSNRIASLNAVVAMPAESAADAGLSTETEVARLNGMLRLLRTLAARPAGRVVALDAAALLESVVELHATHPSLRGVSVAIEVCAAMSPVLAPEGPLVRALLLALTHARTAAAADGRLVRARCDSERERVIFDLVPSSVDVAADGDEPFVSASACPSSPETRAALALLSGVGGELLDAGDGRVRISMPALPPRAARAQGRRAPHGS